MRIARMLGSAKRVHYAGQAPATGTFVAPHVFELANASDLTEEVFGPVLHVVRYKASGLDALLEAIDSTGYGLTLGVHSRIDETVRRVVARLKTGNVYVNRNMIGAVVGTQPFGGHGLSGTGPKAGGPHYLLRFANEQTVTINTAAAGGNASLIAMGNKTPASKGWARHAEAKAGTHAHAGGASRVAGISRAIAASIARGSRSPCQIVVASPRSPSESIRMPSPRTRVPRPSPWSRRSTRLTWSGASASTPAKGRPRTVRSRRSVTA